MSNLFWLHSCSPEVLGMLRKLHAFCIRCQPVNVVAQGRDGEVIFGALLRFVLRVQAGQVRAGVSSGRSFSTSLYKGHFNAQLSIDVSARPVRAHSCNSLPHSHGSGLATLSLTSSWLRFSHHCSNSSRLTPPWPSVLTSRNAVCASSTFQPAPEAM